MEQVNGVSLVLRISLYQPTQTPFRKLIILELVSIPTIRQTFDSINAYTHNSSNFLNLNRHNSLSWSSARCNPTLVSADILTHSLIALAHRPLAMPTSSIFITWKSHGIRAPSGTLIRLSSKAARRGARSPRKHSARRSHRDQSSGTERVSEPVVRRCCVRRMMR
jgi:hypothetical protein